MYNIHISLLENNSLYFPSIQDKISILTSVLLKVSYNKDRDVPVFSCSGHKQWLRMPLVRM